MRRKCRSCNLNAGVCIYNYTIVPSSVVLFDLFAFQVFGDLVLHACFEEVLASKGRFFGFFPFCMHVSQYCGICI